MGSSVSLERPRPVHPGPLDVRLSVEPAADCPCPLGLCGASAAKQSLSATTTEDGTCRLVMDTDEGATYERTSGLDRCPCPAFGDHDCVNELLEVRDRNLIFSVTIPDRTHLPPLIEGLRTTGATVSVNRILTAGGERETDPGLTDKQREAFLIAVEAGYYDRPRGATLDDIAAELDITTSAVSQRLTAVKRRLARTYAQRYDDALSR